MRDYRALEAPEWFKGVDLLKPRQVNEFFEWYVKQSEERINILMEHCLKTTEGNLRLDFTPESLIDLWKWYETQMELVEKDPEELRKEIENTPVDFREDISKTDFSNYTYALIIDIAFYFAEVMLRNNPTLHWGYITKPKNDINAKCPVLKGFSYNQTLNPVRIVTVLSLRSKDEKEINRLYEVYHVWEDSVKIGAFSL